MSDCIFCKIADGSIPSTKVHEDSDYLAFLDIRPHRLGHVLIVPKTHYLRVWDMPNVGEAFELAKKIVKAQEQALSPDFVISLVFGEQVPHAHIQLIPAKKGDGANVFTEYPVFDKDTMDDTAQKIRDALVE